MRVTDQQVGTVRALLSGNTGEARQLTARISAREDAIRLVAEVRSGSDWLAEAIDADSAEQVLTASLTGRKAPDLDPDELRRILQIFTAVMARDAGLDARQLEDLLARSREEADGILGRHQV